MMRLHRLLVVLLLLAGPVLAAGRGAYLGHLTGVEGPVEGARIEDTEVRLASDAGEQSARVDALGSFRFDNLEPGAYHLMAQHPAGYNAERYVTVHVGTPESDEIVLASPSQLALGSALWGVLAFLLGLAGGGAMLLYGRVMDSPPKLPWGRRPTRGWVALREHWTPLLVALLAWCLAFGLFRALSPSLQPLSLGVASTVSCILGSLLSAGVILIAVSRRPRTSLAIAALVVGVALVLFCRLGPRVDDLAQLGVLPGTLCWLGIGLGMLAWTTAAGWLFSLGCKQPSYVLLAALVGALIDIYLVFYGHTGEVMAGRNLAAQQLREMALLPWPVLGSDLIFGVVGYGDFLFLALFLAAAQKFEFGLVRNFWAQVAAITVGFILAQMLSALDTGIEGLPALPFMGAFLVLANRDRFHLTAEERRRIFGFVGILALALAVRAGLKLRAAPAGQERIEVTATNAPRDHDYLRQPFDLKLLGALGSPQLGPVSRADDGCSLQPVALGPEPGLTARLALPAGTGRPTPERSTASAPPAVVLAAERHATDAELLGWARAGLVCLALDLPAATGDEPEIRRNAERLHRVGIAMWRGIQYIHERREAGGDVALLAEEATGYAAVPLSIAADAAKSGGLRALVLINCGTTDEPGSPWELALARASERERESWLRGYAPSRWAPQLSVPTLSVASANHRVWPLNAMTRLVGMVPRHGRLLILPNQAAGPSGSDLAAVRAWLRSPLGLQPGSVGLPSLSIGAEDGHLVLSSRIASARELSFHLSVADTADAGWPGRWWTRLPARRVGSSWRLAVRVSAPAANIAVFAEAVGADGERSCSYLKTFTPIEAKLRLVAAPWPSPVVAPPGPGVWRTAEGQPLAPAAGGELPLKRGVTILTNQVAVLRRLGPQAASLSLVVSGAGPTSDLTIEVISHFGQPAEKRWHRVLRLAGQQGRATTSLSGAGEVIDWDRVDALTLTPRPERDGSAGEPLALHSVELTGAMASSVQEVE